MTNSNLSTKNGWQLLSLIVLNKDRDRVEDCLEELDIRGYFCIHSKGTSKPSILKSLGLVDSARLFYMIPVLADRAQEAFDHIKGKLDLQRAGTGMTFRHPLVFLLNDEECASPEKLSELVASVVENKGEIKMFKKISVIMDLGRAEEVMEAARAAGARGGTVLHGHGSVGEEAGKLFGIRIVPEKELLLIIAPTSDTPNIVKAIAEELNLDEAGNGILYIEDITDAGGLVK